MAKTAHPKPPLPVLTPEQLKANRDALRARMLAYNARQRTRSVQLLAYLSIACHASASARYDGWFLQDEHFLASLAPYGVGCVEASALAQELEQRGLLEFASTGPTETLQVQTPRSEVRRALDGSLISSQPLRPATTAAGQSIPADRSSSLRRVRLF